MTPDARPVRVKLRDYSSNERHFLKKMVGGLEHSGLVYFNPTSTWASALLIVPKPGPAGYCFTADLRPPNKYTKKHGYSMPNIEQKLAAVTKSILFTQTWTCRRATGNSSSMETVRKASRSLRPMASTPRKEFRTVRPMQSHTCSQHWRPSSQKRYGRTSFFSWTTSSFTMRTPPDYSKSWTDCSRCSNRAMSFYTQRSAHFTALPSAGVAG